MNGVIEPIVGRYVHVDIDGEMYRIYFEESGTGIPLVCLHTAGSMEGNGGICLPTRRSPGTSA